MRAARISAFQPTRIGRAMFGKAEDEQQVAAREPRQLSVDGVVEISCARRAGGQSTTQAATLQSPGSARCSKTKAAHLSKPSGTDDQVEIARGGPTVLGRDGGDAVVEDRFHLRFDRAAQRFSRGKLKSSPPAKVDARSALTVGGIPISGADVPMVPRPGPDAYLRHTWQSKIM